jgi:hypothetical protein
MRIIKEILLTEYIGAILVAVLVADAFTTFVITLEQQLTFHFRSTGSLPSGHDLSLAYSLFSAIVRIAFYLGFAYLLWLWLYGIKSAADEEDLQMEKGNNLG